MELMSVSQSDACHLPEKATAMYIAPSRVQRMA